MVKKKVKRKSIKKVPAKRAKTSLPKVKMSEDVAKLNAILVENFVSLQRAMTNITVKFESLSEQISKLLQLFEISAKSFAEKLASSTGTPDIEKDKEFLDKLNKLLDQNKVIAKGLTLMEEKIRDRLYGNSPSTPTYSPRPLPRRMPPPGSGMSGYTESSMESERKTQELS